MKSGGGKGHVYELNLHAPQDAILHWNKALPDQSPYVRGALDRADLKPDLMSPDFEQWTAKNQPRLRQAGIPAVAYNEGAKNYMITNPEIIEIIRKYGIAAPAALPPALNALQQQQTPAMPGVIVDDF